MLSLNRLAVSIRRTACLLILAAAAPLAGAASPVTTAGLLDEMIDLDRLTRWPDPAYVTRQFSSYERSSKLPREDWFANKDRGYFLRTETIDGRTEHVMMDTDGPGAIVRIWSANPGGTIRVYLDGRDTPTIETEMSDLLDGKHPHMPVPLAGKRAAGHTLWFPIPYARHCKVTATADDIYYHVNYRTYPDGTSVKTFSPSDLEQAAERIRTVAEQLSKPKQIGSVADDAPRAKAFTATHRLAPGDKAATALAEGTAMVAGLRINLDAEDVPAAARGVIMRMTFDGTQTVECPLGDFFGSAPGVVPFQTIAVGMSTDPKPSMWCHWRMPYRESAELAFENKSGVDVALDVRAVCLPCDWDDRSMLFHAGWRTEKHLPTRPFVDWRHLEVRGKGRFVGGTLHFINAVKMWWGEGDEKIYVDGEKFPSHFGTGTEDYYSYAWGSPELFSHAYHAQTVCDGPGTYGNTSLNRLHVLDDIPFTESFVFDMENWHWTTDIKVTRAATCYWYARPGAKDFYKPITDEDAKLVEVPAFGKPGVVEGEDLFIIEKAGGTGPQENDWRYSSEAYLRWHPGKVGDKLKFGLQCERAGRYRITACLANSWDFAKVRFYVNGDKAGDVIDAYVEGGGPSEEIVLGTFDLKRGQNELTVEIVGRNDASKGIIFGLDYLRLTKEKPAE